MKRSYCKPTFFLKLMLFTLVSGCANQPNFAPVTAYFPETQKDHGRYHQVQPGETLAAISANVGLDVRVLAQWNNLHPPYLLKAGQQIKLFAPNPLTEGKNQASSIKNKTSSPKQVFLPVEKPQVIANKSTNKKPIEEVVTEKTLVAEEKKSTISIDNEKVLKLNFQWPVKGKVLKAFSQAHNKGIDIAGSSGQQVTAAEAGKVVYSGQGLLGYGNLLIIKHNELYLSAYGNNSRLLVAEGDVVNKGQAVAEIGQIGSKRPALHFEIRKNGKPLDPINFLSKK
ncbi:MAG: peptidoglycan DD-metalloendopeptidase family protein [Methylococcales bacterium]|nr:peptidoglycan DD-metalloendopeptidase family protein [Methylococcaceae bacterium]